MTACYMPYLFSFIFFLHVSGSHHLKEVLTNQRLLHWLDSVGTKKKISKRQWEKSLYSSWRLVKNLYTCKVLMNCREFLRNYIWKKCEAFCSNVSPLNWPTVPFLKHRGWPLFVCALAEIQHERNHPSTYLNVPF